MRMCRPMLSMMLVLMIIPILLSNGNVSVNFSVNVSVSVHASVHVNGNANANIYSCFEFVMPYRYKTNPASCKFLSPVSAKKHNLTMMLNIIFLISHILLFPQIRTQPHTDNITPGDALM